MEGATCSLLAAVSNQASPARPLPCARPALGCPGQRAGRAEARAGPRGAPPPLPPWAPPRGHSSRRSRHRHPRAPLPGRFLRGAPSTMARRAALALLLVGLLSTLVPARGERYGDLGGLEGGAGGVTRGHGPTRGPARGRARRDPREGLGDVLQEAGLGGGSEDPRALLPAGQDAPCQRVANAPRRRPHGPPTFFLGGFGLTPEGKCSVCFQNHKLR